MWGIRQFRPYLYGRAFKARTDHNSLKWLHNFREPEGQVARWLELLSEYNFQVIHRPGLQHRNADALSRSPCKQCGQGEEIVADLAEQAPVADVASMQFCSHSSLVYRRNLYHAARESRSQAIFPVAALQLHTTQVASWKYLPQDSVAPERLHHFT